MDPLRAYDLPLGNGVTLPVREHGDPEGLPLLLLHGYSDTWRSFLPVLSLFPRDICAIAFTARGHGEATKPQGGYAPSDFAADAVALLDRLTSPGRCSAGTRWEASWRSGSRSTAPTGWRA